MSCTYDRDAKTHIVKREHYDDCDSPKDCSGCVECSHDEHGNPVRHCRIRRGCSTHLREHEYACPNCLAKIRGNLRTIVERMALMSDEASEKGVDSEALNLAGPHATPAELKRRLIHHARIGMDVEEPDTTDPYTVLADRERLIREDLGHDETVLVSSTLSGCARYLEWVLTDLARDETQVLYVSDLMSETGKLVTHLETVQHDEFMGEEGAPCPDCKIEKPPRLRKTFADDDRSGANDEWVCPRDRNHRWDEARYRKHVGTEYRNSAPTLNMTDMEARTGIAGSTLRRWATKPTGAPLLKSCGRGADGRKVYRVADVEELRHTLRAVS